MATLTKTQDCCEFNIKGAEKDFNAFIQAFESESIYLPNKKRVDDSPIAYGEYVKQEDTGEYKWTWFAGRYIGEAIINERLFKIEPRYGFDFIGELLEEIYNIKISKQKSANDKSFSNDAVLTYLWKIFFIKAMKYPFPRQKNIQQHLGESIKGRLNISKSIMPFLKHKKVVSETKYKQPNIVMASIVYRAYKILTQNNKSHFESNILSEIKLLRSVLSHNQEATKSDYHRLKYRSTDIGYKALIDLSWNIITTNKFGKKHSGTNGLNFFLDVAELWENYIRSLLKKEFPNWQISSPEITLYSDSDLLQRKIIPDIVMQKDNDVIIFDTKYKRMEQSRLDIDRTDFFQIHTYANYYQTKGYNVKMFGLIYPVDKKEQEQTIFKKSSINGVEYVVIGIPVSNIDSDKEKNHSIDTSFLEELQNAI